MGLISDVFHLLVPFANPPESEMEKKVREEEQKRKQQDRETQERDYPRMPGN